MIDDDDDDDDDFDDDDDDDDLDGDDDDDDDDDDAATDSGPPTCYFHHLPSSLHSVRSFFPSFRSPPWHPNFHMLFPYLTVSIFCEPWSL